MGGGREREGVPLGGQDTVIEEGPDAGVGRLLGGFQEAEQEV